jgi:hypothetical protein
MKRTTLAHGAVLAILLNACAQSSSQVDLTVVADSSLSDAMVTSVHTLNFSVDGAETAMASYPLAHPFADARQERVVYKVHAAAGMITFMVDALDSSGDTVATGATTVTLGSGGEIPATVTLSVPGTGSDGGPSPPDLSVPPDLDGACAHLSEGATCAPSNSCNDFVCKSGVCTKTAKPDNTQCKASTTCNNPSTCTAGVCTPHPFKNGTACGTKSFCNGPICVAGVCTPNPINTGAVCAQTTNPCQTAGKCNAGKCGAITNKSAGTSCPDLTCHTGLVCDGNGNCAGGVRRPDGYNYDSSNPWLRCCGGNAINTQTDKNNCGGCGVPCLNGHTCITSHGQAYCSCTSSTTSDCWSGCCSTYYGTPYVCAAGNCQTNTCLSSCPGGAHVGSTSSAPVCYCHY